MRLTLRPRATQRPAAVIAKAVVPDERAVLRWMVVAMMGLGMILAAGAVRAESHAQMIKSHGYSFFGDLKYGPEFPHLDYVNPEAPKGGEISVWFPGTFDTFNPYSRKGRAGYLASAPYESLMAATADDYGALYGLLAESLEYPEDQAWVIFNLNPNAKFTDGSPVTAEDVVFSHNIFIEQGLPSYGEQVKKRVTGVEALNPLQVKFTFAEDIPRRGLISQVASNIVFSKADFERNGYRLDEPTLTPFIGSGPYLLDSYDINQRIVYKRDPNYWGKDLPLNIGTGNYDSIRVEYFADSNAAFEGFKAGAYTFRTENSSKTWATSYDFPALESGAVVQTTLPNGNVPRASGFVFNLNRPQFQDVRVREAIALAYNFTWTNNSLQYGLFAQRESFWQNSDHAAVGVPEGKELELLQSLGDLIDPSVLTDPVTMPHDSGERQLDRKNLRAASRLLDAAGWEAGDDGLRRNAAGETLKLEFLESSAGFDRILLPYVENLKALGVDATYNRVDPAQFTNRRRDRDYDMIVASYSTPLLPSTGLRQQFGSEDAATSVFNAAGFADEGADRIIDYIVGATDTETVAAGARALDRVLRAERFLIPIWYLDEYWVSHFDMYEHPETLPPFSLGQLDFWWINPEKEAALKASGALR